MLRAGMVAAAAALLGSTSAYAQSAAWTLSEASGRVVIRDSAGDHPGARGAAIPAGATVMTGPTGRAILVRGQDFVTLSTNARMRLPGAAQAGGLFQMIQEWGNALFRIEHRRDPHFAVQAPYLAAVVKGTTFSVTVTREGSSVQVIEGAVEAATADGGAHELVRPGNVASVMASDQFRLMVQGQNAHSVDSPARGRGGSSAPAAPMPNGPSNGGGDHDDSGAVEASAPGSAGSHAAGYDDIAWQQVANSVVVAPIEAKPADLGKITDGLVSGKSNGTVVASAVAVARAGTSGAGNGNGSGLAAGNGNGNGSANGNGGGSASANGSGNGNTGNSNAGNGNGNSGNGNSGNGNGNSGNGNGNSGNGNGNSGNGNGNSGNGNGNSGNGNGNSGNGNGNSGNGNGNSGNGNGNSGNGNGNSGNGNGNSGNGNGNSGNGNGNSGNGNGNSGNGNGNSGNGNGNGGHK